MALKTDGSKQQQQRALTLILGRVFQMAFGKALVQ